MAINFMDLWQEIKGTEWESALSSVRETIDRLSLGLEESETQGEVHYPLPGSRFRALTLTPLSRVKCVIAGQDPYPGNHMGVPFANGLAFSVPKGMKMPASLKNIAKELSRDGYGELKDGDLTPWAEQGVLLLNSVMTLIAGQSNSHASIGWQKISLAILRAVEKSNSHSVYLGFGRFSHQLYRQANIPESRQIKTSHPSPLGAKKSAKDGSFSSFTGSGCFSSVNNMLLSSGHSKIAWV